MKTIRCSVVSLTMLVLVSFTAYSQKPPANTSDTSKTETLKDKWTKHYNEVKPKLDGYLAKVKDDDKHPDFKKEVEKLNKMLEDFKGEIDKWDNATKDQQAKYSDALKEDYKELKAQEDKVKRMWDRMNEKTKKEDSEKHD